MPPISTDDIRAAYLNFFKEKYDHDVIKGASLIPENDPTVLFTTAGMHPLVPYLLGEPHPSGKRLVDVQKCIRTQDIDEVGDASHLTMFEMLGNWSLGEYFKEGAIKMSFEFLTQVLEIPVEKLAVTCFCGDDDAPKDEEAAKIWKEVGIPENRIGFLPKKDNWWGPAGQTGPCGPDTEMFVWMPDGKPEGNPETHPDGWMEVWNDVFMQYNKNEDGSYTPLEQQNVDTGMGLERIAAVMQGVKNVYETDRMKPILDVVLEMSDQKDESMRHPRIIVDHIKASVFMIVDGVRPSNVDQGYILRRIIRRAIRSARQLRIEHDGTFTPSIAKAVIDQYQHAYPQLKKLEKDIISVLQSEEQQFVKTLREGMKQFEKLIENAGTQLDGVTAFHLYDTYGFPLELTKEMAAEQGMTIDEDGFKKAFEEHQKLSRAGAEAKFKGGLADNSTETAKLHTATHLLNAALRKVLGDHVYQKGSNITAERLRFDFSHDEKMTPEQIAEVERLVNEAIQADLPISYHITNVEDAKAEGAIGVFDDRYGNEVKVYVVGEGDPSTGSGVFSREICGGPHIGRTGMLGSFKIKKEESSSSGVRRIKGIVKDGPKEIEIAKEIKN